MPAHHNHLFKFLQTKQNRTKIDHIMMVAAVAHPLIAVPQALQIYITKEAAGLSLFTWFVFGLLGLVFMAYGIAHRLKPYILMQLCWMVVNVSIVIGILLYGT